MRPFLPECKGLAACGHLFESPLPSGQHLYHFYLDLKDQNELAHPARRPPCPQIGAADVEYTGGGDVFVKSVAQIALVLSLFFRLCPILCSKGHIARVSNSGSGTGTWWFQWPSPSLSFVSSRISHLKKVWAIMIIFFWNNIRGPLTPENFVGSDEGSVCNPPLLLSHWPGHLAHPSAPM